MTVNSRPLAFTIILLLQVLVCTGVGCSTSTLNGDGTAKTATSGGPALRVTGVGGSGCLSVGFEHYVVGSWSGPERPDPLSDDYACWPTTVTIMTLSTVHGEDPGDKPCRGCADGTSVIVRGRYVHIRGDSGGERLWAVNAAGKGGAAALEGLTRAPAVVVGDDPAAIAPHIRRLQVSQVELSGGFRDLSALAGCSSIRRLSLPGSHALTNLDALGTLTGLEDLSVAYCSGLTDLEGLRRLKNLTSLLLTDLDHVIDLKVLEGMTKLRMLSLHGCTGLTSVEALQGLSSLKEVNLSGCTGLSAEQVGNLKKALPDCSIEWSPPKGPPGGKATKKTE